MNSQQLTISEALQQAITLQKANRFQDAERLYRAILQVQPNHPGANHNIGVLAAQIGKPEAGLPYLKRAIEANPMCYQFWITYADKLTKTKQIDDALRMLEHARSSGLPSDVINKIEYIVLKSKENPSLQSSLSNGVNENIRCDNKVVLDDKNKTMNFIAQQFSCGKYENTEIISRDFIRQYPNDAFGYKMLGAVLAQCKKSKEAVGVLEKGLNCSAHDHEIYNALAIALEDLGRLDDALCNYKKALEVNQSCAEIYSNMGGVLQKLGRLDEALLNCEKSLELQPGCAEVYSNIGVILQKQGRLDEALLNFTKALELKPDRAEIYSNMGFTLKELGRIGEALSNYEKALEIKPDYANVYNEIGVILQDLGRFDEAFLNYEKALKIKPYYPEAYNNMGISFKNLGKLDEALLSFKKALELKFDYAEAYFNASDIKQFRLEHSVISGLNKIIISPEYMVQEKMNAHFAFGNLYNRNKKYSDAFMHIELGHKLRSNINRSEGHPYRHDLLLDKLSLFKDVFTRQFFMDRIDWGLAVDTPIFIVGFPRSGTSLVEQILSSHSSVYGGGELNSISQFVSSCVDFDDIKNQEQLLELISHDKMLEYSKKYLEKINIISNNSMLVTDKMPHNFQHLWFLSLLFKNVKILHCTRGAEDTCLSCYFKKFRKGHEYLDSLQDLAKHYKYYLEMIDLWRSVLPVPIHDVSYEALVDDPETEIRNLISFCNLDFEEQCFEFYKTDRPVKTASATQVREKMYTSSVGKWKKYEQFLGPLLDELYKKE